MVYIARVLPSGPLGPRPHDVVARRDPRPAAHGVGEETVERTRVGWAPYDARMQPDAHDGGPRPRVVELQVEAAHEVIGKRLAGRELAHEAGVVRVPRVRQHGQASRCGVRAPMWEIVVEAVR